MATEILRPDAAGDQTGITYGYPGATIHWSLVDEAVADDVISYVYSRALNYQRDLYNLPAHSVGSGTISSIKIYFRISISNAVNIVYAKPSQKSGVTVTDGTEVSKTGVTTFETFSQTYTTNPATGVAWTWDEIDALQIGVQLKADYNDPMPNAGCTQVYVEVDYTPPSGRSQGFIIG